MHAIIVTTGSDGDVFPFVGIGAALRARGHQVTLASNQTYLSLGREYHLNFRALFSKEETDQLFANQDLWHPFRSGVVGARWGCRFTQRTFDVLSELSDQPETILVANPTVFAARMVQEKRAKKLASVVIGPWFIPSGCAPPKVTGVPNLPAQTPRPILKLWGETMHAIGDYLIKSHINGVRRQIGLNKIRRVFRWWYSPQLVIGMFPDWYAPPQSDWPSRTRLAGFSMFDGSIAKGLASDLRAYCAEGPAPVALTFGTEMWHAAPAFRTAIAACAKLGRRCLVLTKYPDQLPNPLPAHARHCSFAPFGQLFPHCAAVVHHGGMGTTARALATGTPQLVLPFAFDQLDNAVRVAGLEVGDWLKHGKRSADQIAHALAPVLTKAFVSQARAVAERFTGEDATGRAVGWIEQLAAS